MTSLLFLSFPLGDLVKPSLELSFPKGSFDWLLGFSNGPLLLIEIVKRSGEVISLSLPSLHPFPHPNPVFECSKDNHKQQNTLAKVSQVINHKHYKQQDHQFWWLSLECLKRCMDQNDLFHNAPPSWAFTNKQKLKLFTTFLWICRVQTKRKPTKTKDVQRCLTSPPPFLAPILWICRAQTKRQPTKTKDFTKFKSKSTRFCSQLHVRHTKATREMWPQERIWVF